MSDDLAELRQAIMQIGMLSQVSAANLENNAKSTDDDIGGKRPSGGIVAKDDFAEGFALRSVEYFDRRLRRAHTARAVTELLAEAMATLEAWKRTPIPAGQPPALNDPQWKRWIAETDLPPRDLVRMFGVSRQYIHQVRKAYRDAA
jgi:hypothetical protein